MTSKYYDIPATSCPNHLSSRVHGGKNKSPSLIQNTVNTKVLVLSVIILVLGTAPEKSGRVKSPSDFSTAFWGSIYIITQHREQDRSDQSSSRVTLLQHNVKTY